MSTVGIAAASASLLCGAGQKMLVHVLVEQRDDPLTLDEGE